MNANVVRILKAYANGTLGLGHAQLAIASLVGDGTITVAEGNDAERYLCEDRQRRYFMGSGKESTKDPMR